MFQDATRVSCGSLCRITDNGHLLLIMNRNRRKKGIYELSPVGGAIEVDNYQVLTDQKIRFVTEKENSKDLRLFVHDEDMETFRQWFYRRRDREVSPFREIYEELVDETQVLAALREEDVNIRFRRIVEATRTTERAGVTGIYTRYFFEIFEVDIRANDVMLMLKSASPFSGVFWIDEETASHEKFIPLRIDGHEQNVRLNTHFLLLDE